MAQKRIVSLDNPAPANPGMPAFVQPNASPQAVGYAAGVAARRGGGLPKYATPVAGGPTPPIPALEAPHQEGMTMADQAARTRGNDSARHVSAAMASHAGSGIVMQDHQEQAPGMVMNPAQLPLLPTDTLPDEALKDPQYHHGAGSRMAQMQPHMAMKYGIVRNGKHMTPQELVSSRQPAPDFRGRPRRSGAEMAQDLQQVLNAQTGGAVAREQASEGPTPPAGLPRNEAEAEAQAAAGPGGAASRTGSAPMVPILDATSEEAEDRVKKMVQDMDDFDFERLRREMLSDVLKNPGQQQIVEKRCAPLDIGDLIMNNSIRQRVPILPGKFEPTFESMQGHVELQLKQLLIKENKSIAVTEAYLMDKYAVMCTTAGVAAINGNPCPPMYDQKGDFNEDLFWEKFRWMLKRNIHMLASLGVHYSWFEARVRKLFVVDEGKGG